jgi:hypothetical protein
VEAILWRLVETAVEQAPDGHWRGGRKLLPVRLAVEDCHQGLRHRVAPKGTLACEHLVEYAAERPDVGSLVGLLPAGLLRTHVGGRPDDRSPVPAADRDALGRRIDGSLAEHLHLERPCQPEIEHLDLTTWRQLDVGRLQVAVDDAALVRRLDGRGDPSGHPQCLLHLHPARAQPLLQRLPLDQLQHREADAVGFLEAVNRRDVGMRDRRQDPRLPLQLRQPLGIGGELLG